MDRSKTIQERERREVFARTESGSLRRSVKRVMDNNRQSLNERKRKFADLSTTEILAIVEEQDRDHWTDEDLAAAAELLRDRRAGIAVGPDSLEMNPSFCEVPTSIVVLRVCAVLYFVVSAVGAAVVLARHENLDTDIAYFVILTLFQGLLVCTVLLVIALIADKVTRIAAILERER